MIRSFLIRNRNRVSGVRHLASGVFWYQINLNPTQIKKEGTGKMKLYIQVL
jgi:hypothetical protein